MRVLLVVPVVAVLTSSPVFCEQQPPDVAIAAAVQKYVTAFNAGDADGAAATYTPTGSHTYAQGFTHHGRGEIAQGLKEMLAGAMKGARISIKSLKITPLAPTVAVEEEGFSISGLKTPDGQVIPDVHGLCLATHQLVDQQWFAAAVQCLVPPTPARTR